ncbi:MAG: 30S ribosomal protein S20 [Spirochaetales bacterium]|nr:30S ribosomal protein S20 [Spirochaetales bacterium]
MPNSLNAAKRHRQSLTRRMRNKTIKSSVRTSIKAFEVAVKKHDREAAEVNFNKFVKLIDTAAGKGVYHRNTAARKKSRLHKVLVGMAS